MNMNAEWIVDKQLQVCRDQAQRTYHFFKAMLQKIPSSFWIRFHGVSNSVMAPLSSVISRLRSLNGGNGRSDVTKNQQKQARVSILPMD